MAAIVSELVVLSSKCGACNERIVEVKLRARLHLVTIVASAICECIRVMFIFSQSALFIFLLIRRPTGNVPLECIALN